MNKGKYFIITHDFSFMLIIVNSYMAQKRFPGKLESTIINVGNEREENSIITRKKSASTKLFSAVSFMLCFYTNKNITNVFEIIKKKL